jgi:hypothetical protein
LIITDVLKINVDWIIMRRLGAAHIETLDGDPLADLAEYEFADFWNQQGKTNGICEKSGG